MNTCTPQKRENEKIRRSDKEERRFSATDAQWLIEVKLLRHSVSNAMQPM